MYDVNKTMDPVMKKLDEQVDKGISSSNIDWLCKLSEIGKNMKKIEYYDSVIEEMQRGHSYGDGHSERRKRDSMGRYSRHDGYERGSSYNQGGYSEARERYMDDKHSYRSTRSPESKREMTDSLHDCMEKLRMELDEMEANADSREEREMIREMRKEIGKLA